MSDDRDSNVVHLSPRGDDSGSVPEAPDIGGLFYTEPPEEIPAAPPESPEETTMELPVIPRPMDPESALASEGITAAPGADESGADPGEDYVHRRSLAERLGDWLEYRIALGRARMESEAPYQEAEIARKVELLNAKTAREVALAEQQNKLREAQSKAQTARAGGGKTGGGGGKPSPSGLGSDKGGGKRSPSGSAGSGRGAGGGRSSGANSSGGAGSRGKGSGSSSGGGNSSKGPGKGSDRPGGGRNGTGKGNQSSGGPKGRQNGSGGSGGSGKSGSRGESGSKNRKENRSSSGPASDRSHSRQERAGARQAARQQRRGASQAANLADRSKDRDQARENKQADWEERRRKKAQRDAAKKAKREREREDSSGTSRWAKRRSARKDKAAKSTPATDGKADGAAKGAGGGSTDSPKSAPGGPADSPGKSGPDEDTKTAPGTSAGAEGPSADGPGAPGSRNQTAEWPGHETKKPSPEQPTEEDIPDAEIIAFALDRPTPTSYPPRPGTTRPDPQNEESTVGSTTSQPSQHLAAQHRTNVTFDEFLVEITNIALIAMEDTVQATEIAEVAGKLADHLRAMATDLTNDHNIDTRVTNLVSDLADSAGRLKLQAQRCADTCEIAAQGALLAAGGVARTYREDLQAMEDGGLTHASAAAHH